MLSFKRYMCPVCVVSIFLLSSLIMADGTCSAETCSADLVKSNTRFGLDLYKKISQKQNGGENIFISPASILSALSMTSLGAKGDTLTQMKKVMHLDKVGDYHGKFKKLNSILTNERDGADLKLANKLYGAEGYKFNELFDAEADKNYGAKLEAINFHESEMARSKINNWVEGKTEHKIKNLLPAGSIGGNTALVLVNALYFKGTWQYKFDKEQTRKDKFYVTNDKQTQIDFMTTKNKFKTGYLDQVNARALELPYADKSFSMLIVMPNEIGKFDDFEKAFDYEMLETLNRDVESGESVTVMIPKFTITCEAKLKEYLMQLGMSDLFVSGKADLSGLDGTRRIFMSEVYHKTFVDVNEEGTEAAAATGGVAAFRTMPSIFKVDRPFLFFIKDNKSGTVVFMGRIMDPSSK